MYMAKMLETCHEWESLEIFVSAINGEGEFRVKKKRKKKKENERKFPKPIFHFLTLPYSFPRDEFEERLPDINTRERIFHSR